MGLGWFKEIVEDGVDPLAPGIYEWRIAAVGIYVGQYTNPRRPRLEYANNIRRLCDGLPYRQSRPLGYRLIHRELAKAKLEGRQVTLTFVENHLAKTARNRRERELILLRAAEADRGGLRLLNGILQRKIATA
jgi:hypothetical protein